MTHTPILNLTACRPVYRRENAPDTAVVLESHGTDYRQKTDTVRSASASRFRCFHAFLAIAACFILVSGCGNAGTKPQPGQAKKSPAVSVETAQSGPISLLLDLTGETVAVESAVIASTIEGRISFLPWREGDRIERSQGKPVKLVEIDRELYRAEFRAAEAALDVAKARLEDMKAGTRPEEIAKASQAVKQIEESAAFAKTDLDRIEKLAQSGSVPGEVLEKARVALAGETARLLAARQHLEMLEAGFTKTAIAVQEAVIRESSARLDLARARLDECVITAPFAGTVTRVYARSGDMAAARSPLIEISDLGSVVVRAAVPESRSEKLREGMPARVSFDAMSGKSFSLEISRVFPEIDRTMRTRTVEISLPGVTGIVPGMFARVQIEIDRVESAVTIPITAVAANPAGALVAFVVIDGKAVQRRIQTGIEQAGRVQIVSGVSPGEPVVVAGNEKLKDGVEVRVVEPAKQGGKPGLPGSSADEPRDKKGRAE